MSVKVAKSYQYNVVGSGAFVEFYFPKRVAYQSEIVKAL
jgi:hypothetical protein